MPSMTGKHLAAAAAGVAMKSIRAATIARHPLSPPILVQFAIGAVHDILGIFSEKPCPPPPAGGPSSADMASHVSAIPFLPAKRFREKDERENDNDPNFGRGQNEHRKHRGLQAHMPLTRLWWALGTTPAREARKGFALSRPCRRLRSETFARSVKCMVLAERQSTRAGRCAAGPSTWPPALDQPRSR